MIDQKRVAEILKVFHEGHIPYDWVALRDQLAVFMSQIRSCSESERAEIRSQIGPQHGLKLVCSAVELAVRAVRNHDPNDVALGLLAVVLEGAQDDYRESTIALCLLHHSAMKLGVDPAPLFHEAAAFGSSSMQELVIDYLRDGSKEIRDMWYAEAYGPDGFYYASTGGVE